MRTKRPPTELSALERRILRAIARGKTTKTEIVLSTTAYPAEKRNAAIAGLADRKLVSKEFVEPEGARGNTTVRFGLTAAGRKVIGKIGEWHNQAPDAPSA